MMKQSILIPFTSFLVGLFIPLQAQTNTTDTYQLIWSDEFNTDGKPDPEKWAFQEGFIRNEETQWYHSENAFCENGVLNIVGRKETKPNPKYLAGSADWKTNRKEITYTSACLITKNKSCIYQLQTLIKWFKMTKKLPLLCCLLIKKVYRKKYFH